MTMIVNQDLCRGCGTCLEVCPNNAILLRDGKAIIDQAKCSSCQICVEVCPTGAIQLVRTVAPAILEKPYVIDILPSQAVNSSLPDRSGWGQIALAFAGQYVFPRLVDILGTYLERHLTPSVREQTSTINNLVDSRPFRLRRQRRGRLSKST